MHTDTIGNSKFTFQLAETPQLLEEVYRLRYQVYCHECNFLKPEDYPEGKEKDEYDEHSLHFIASDEEGPIGTMRLILNSALGFPLEAHCNGALQIDKKSLPRNNLAEISRLVISKLYRRRKDDGLYYSPDLNEKTVLSPSEVILKRIRPMAFGLYREIYQESRRRDIKLWYALMEKPLWILLRMHCFVFTPVGTEINVYGPVTPYLGKIEDIEKQVSKRFPQLFEYFLQGLEPEFRPKNLLD